MVNTDVHSLRLLVGGTIAGVVAFLILIVLIILVLVYPFETIVFTEPIEIMNPNVRVPVDGVVKMRVRYQKYINDPGLVVRTLVYDNEEGNEVYLDSSTYVSYRKIGSGVLEELFTLRPNQATVGKGRRIIFTMCYTLFGFRPVMVQYKTGRFEIYKP